MDPEQRRRELLGIAMSKAEKSFYEDLARRLGLSVSDMGRRALADFADQHQVEVDPEVFKR